MNPARHLPHAFRDFRRRARALEAGFTLIEILVVVVFIAIITTMAVLSAGSVGADREISEETERVQVLLGMIQEHAEMQNRDYGLRLEEDRYDFVRFDVRRDEWVPVPGEQYLRARELPPGVRFRLFLDAREAVLRRPAKSDKPKPPQIIAFGSGDLTDFELRLEREQSDHSATIRGSVDGKIEVRTVDEEERP